VAKVASAVLSELVEAALGSVDPVAAPTTALEVVPPTTALEVVPPTTTLEALAETPALDGAKELVVASDQPLMVDELGVTPDQPLPREWSSRSSIEEARTCSYAELEAPVMAVDEEEEGELSHPAADAPALEVPSILQDVIDEVVARAAEAGAHYQAAPLSAEVEDSRTCSCADTFGPPRDLPAPTDTVRAEVSHV
jgi:hypothetical protein